MEKGASAWSPSLPKVRHYDNTGTAVGSCIVFVATALRIMMVFVVVTVEIDAQEMKLARLQLF